MSTEQHIELSDMQLPGLNVTQSGQLPSEAPGMVIDVPRRGIIRPGNPSVIVRKVA